MKNNTKVYTALALVISAVSSSVLSIPFPGRVREVWQAIGSFPGDENWSPEFRAIFDQFQITEDGASEVFVNAIHEVKAILATLDNGEDILRLIEEPYEECRSQSSLVWTLSWVYLNYVYLSITSCNIDRAFTEIDQHLHFYGPQIERIIEENAPQVITAVREIHRRMLDDLEVQKAPLKALISPHLPENREDCRKSWP